MGHPPATGWRSSLVAFCHCIALTQSIWHIVISYCGRLAMEDGGDLKMWGDAWCLLLLHVELKENSFEPIGTGANKQRQASERPAQAGPMQQKEQTPSRRGHRSGGHDAPRMTDNGRRVMHTCRAQRHKVHSNASSHSPIAVTARGGCIELSGLTAPCGLCSCLACVGCGGVAG